MRVIGAWIMLSLSLCVCPSQNGPLALAAEAPRPKWEELMDQARRFAAEGNYFAISISTSKIQGGVYVFYNNPNPFCYTYVIPGDWVAGLEAGLWKSRDGRAAAGVLFRLASELEGFEGTTLVERMGNRITQEYEKSMGQRLGGVELVPFKSARSRSWKWKPAPVNQAGQLISFGTKVFFEIRPDAVVQITVGGTEDDDGLARRIIEGLRTTSDPECYWGVLENCLRALSEDR